MILLAAAVPGAALTLLLPMMMFMSSMGGASDSSRSCTRPGLGVVLVSAPTGYTLSARQLEIAGIVINVGRSSGRSDRAILVALAVAAQESRFRNYANDGRGDDLKPDQRRIGRSMELPHDAVGTDHGSLGVFQQQWPWWGTMRELMDPATAAEKFYAALDKVYGWERMSIGEAGQAVQRSAFPRAYDDDVDLARKLLDSAENPDGIAPVSYFGSATDCVSTVFSGEVVMPVAGSDYVDSKSFGRQGALWSTVHTGTDFSTACGIPVLASTGGTVSVRTDQAWSGRWLVTIDAGGGGVVTWYAHMQAISVANGDVVHAGQQIGAVGTEGNSTGCHLHFEVRPGGGAPIDPSTWLAENVGTTIPISGTTSGASAVVMTANLPFTLSNARTQRRVRTLLGSGVDVLLLQEVRHRNISAMVARAKGDWGVWQSPGGRGHNAIIWDRSRFRLARGGEKFGADLGSYRRWIPWVLLESEAGTLPVVNIHMPNNASTDPAQRRRYKVMMDRALGLVSELNRAGLPPIVGGDWNEPLDRSLEAWRPVRALSNVGMVTNWAGGPPCDSTDGHGRRIDGFSFNPRYVSVVDQGCLERGPSDHRPVWMAIRPAR